MVVALPHSSAQRLAALFAGTVESKEALYRNLAEPKGEFPVSKSRSRDHGRDQRHSRNKNATDNNGSENSGRVQDYISLSYTRQSTSNEASLPRSAMERKLLPKQPPAQELIDEPLGLLHLKEGLGTSASALPARISYFAALAARDKEANDPADSLARDVCPDFDVNAGGVLFRSSGSCDLRRGESEHSADGRLMALTTAADSAASSPSNSSESSFYETSDRTLLDGAWRGRTRNSHLQQRSPSTPLVNKLSTSYSVQSPIGQALPLVKSGKKVQYRMTKMCPWIGLGRCTWGNQCNYAHSEDELLPRPDLSRTRLCQEGSSCRRQGCRYAHCEADLRATNAFYKTRLCKFWDLGSCPAGSDCRHAHGESELRLPGDSLSITSKSGCLRTSDQAGIRSSKAKFKRASGELPKFNSTANARDLARSGGGGKMGNSALLTIPPGLGPSNSRTLRTTEGERNINQATYNTRRNRKPFLTGTVAGGPQSAFGHTGRAEARIPIDSRDASVINYSTARQEDGLLTSQPDSKAFDGHLPNTREKRAALRYGNAANRVSHGVGKNHQGELIQESANCAANVVQGLPIPGRSPSSAESKAYSQYIGSAPEKSHSPIATVCASQEHHLLQLETCGVPPTANQLLPVSNDLGRTTLPLLDRRESISSTEIPQLSPWGLLENVEVASVHSVQSIDQLGHPLQKQPSVKCSRQESCDVFAGQFCGSDPLNDENSHSDIVNPEASIGESSSVGRETILSCSSKNSNLLGQPSMKDNDGLLSFDQDFWAALAWHSSNEAADSGSENSGLYPLLLPSTTMKVEDRGTTLGIGEGHNGLSPLPYTLQAAPDYSSFFSLSCGGSGKGPFSSTCDTSSLAFPSKLPFDVDANQMGLPELARLAVVTRNAELLEGCAKMLRQLHPESN